MFFFHKLIQRSKGYAQGGLALPVLSVVCCYKYVGLITQTLIYLIMLDNNSYS